MNLRSKKPRPLTREDKKYRDDRLFVIATEDTYAPDQYFRIFADGRIHVLVLPTEDCRSAPDHVLTRLDDYVKEFELTEDDERWLMLDTDHWVEPNHIANFNHVCTQATQKGFKLAHSNPCFEIWLLLHLTDLDAGEGFKRCKEVVQRLKQLGKYSKRRIDPGHFSLENAAVAVGRAEKLDQSPGDRWPQKTGSHAYKIVRKLLPG